MLFATITGLFVVGVAGLVYWSGQEGQPKVTASLNFPEREPPVVVEASKGKTLTSTSRKKAETVALEAPATTQA